eukprot:125605-Chlamydomonas_euryale.AAC.3
MLVCDGDCDDVIGYCCYVYMRVLEAGNTFCLRAASRDTGTVNIQRLPLASSHTSAGTHAVGRWLMLQLPLSALNTMLRSVVCMHVAAASAAHSEVCGLKIGRARSRIDGLLQCNGTAERVAAYRGGVVGVLSHHDAGASVILSGAPLEAHADLFCKLCNEPGCAQLHGLLQRHFVSCRCGGHDDPSVCRVQRSHPGWSAPCNTHSGVGSATLARSLALARASSQSAGPVQSNDDRAPQKRRHGKLSQRRGGRGWCSGPVRCAVAALAAPRHAGGGGAAARWRPHQAGGNDTAGPTQVCANRSYSARVSEAVETVGTREKRRTAR